VLPRNGAGPAAAETDRVLKTAGRDWHGLAEAIAPPLQPQALQIDWRREVQFCADREWMLNARELNFVGKLSRYRSQPTEKQLAWLHNIFRRPEAAA
jgi:hypothetical protein